MIDLHTHTTASDGRCAPDVLVDRAAAAGVRVLGLTDHDTVAGCAVARDACAARGLEFVPGIEITAIVDELDVHVLGYFLDIESDGLHRFLAAQRGNRIDRLREAVARLRTHGIVLDAEAIVAPAIADPTKSAGRPWVARALVQGGHVADMSEAFERWLVPGRPAFVPRIGARPEEVFARIHDAGGIAALAHPGLVEHDEWIPQFASAGMDALECFHSDHDADATARYLAIAAGLGLAVTGGSDFHGDGHGPPSPGCVTLPAERFAELRALTK